MSTRVLRISDREIYLRVEGTEHAAWQTVVGMAQLTYTERGSLLALDPVSGTYTLAHPFTAEDIGG